jgi:hypothetical protein
VKRSGELRDALAPWLGLVVGLAAWAITHQFGADGTFDDCVTFSPGPIVIVALLGIAASIVAGWLSSRILSDGRQGQARRVIATISVGMAALFSLAMLYPIAAALIIPPCFQ